MWQLEARMRRGTCVRPQGPLFSQLVCPLLGLRVPSVWVSKAQRYLRDGPWSPEDRYSEGERLEVLTSAGPTGSTLHPYLISSLFLPTEEVGAAVPQPLLHPLSGGCCSGSLPTSPGHCVSTPCVSSESPGHCQRQFWACVRPFLHVENLRWNLSLGAWGLLSRHPFFGCLF